MYFQRNPDDGNMNLMSEIQDVEDCCFAINSESILPLIGAQKSEGQGVKEFVGVISIQSTTITDFYYGILGGFDSIVNCERSSLINLRGPAIKMIQPKIAKITSSVIQRVTSDGIDIKFIQPKPSKDTISFIDQAKLEIEAFDEASQRKLIIQANRIINIGGSPIKIESVPQDYFDMNMLILYEGLDEQQRQYGGYIQKGQPPLNIIIKIINNKMYGLTKVGI